MRRLVSLCLLLWAVSCQSGTVVLVATPVAPDGGFHTYRHPSGAFTIRLPSDWAVRDVSRDNAVRVEFSPPANEGLPLSVFVVNTGQVLDTGTLLRLIDEYQATFNGNHDLYTETGRNAQGDGSWRVIGVRVTPIGTRQLNTFIQADKTFLSALEADITNATPARLDQLRAVINTFRADPSAVLNTSAVSAQPTPGANTASGSILFDGLLDWSDSTGGWNINGQLTNNATSAVEAVRITALLYDGEGRILAEQPDVIPNEVIAGGGSAPFTIRFRSGKPAQAVRYELQASARNADYNLPNYVAPENFVKGNETATYNAQGFLTIGGDVVNGTKQLAKFIRVTVTVFDDQGRVVGAESAFVQKPELLPGEVSKYEVTFFQLAGSAVRFLTKVEGRVN